MSKTFFVTKHVTASKGKLIEATTDQEPDEDERVVLRHKNWTFPLVFTVGKDAFASRAAAVKAGNAMIARKIKSLKKQIETLEKKAL